MSYHYLCFGVFNDCKFIDRKFIKYETNEQLHSIFFELNKHISSYLYLELDEQDFDLLSNNNIVAYKRIEKYYALCVSIDFKTCYIWSKDIDPCIVDWFEKCEENDNNIEITPNNIIYKDNFMPNKPNDNVNENPVITLFKRINNNLPK